MNFGCKNENIFGNLSVLLSEDQLDQLLRVFYSRRQVNEKLR